PDQRGGAGSQLPAERLPVASKPDIPPPRRRSDGQGAGGVPGPRADRLRAVRAVPVHPAGARAQRTGRLPVPALHRLPQPRRRDPRDQAGRARMGARVMTPTEKSTPPSDAEPASDGVAVAAWRNLAMATVGFMLNFWAWNLIGPLGPTFGKSLHLG